jgi:hypothetical protein
MSRRVFFQMAKEEKVTWCQARVEGACGIFWVPADSILSEENREL